jgi:preprotein translocase subunit SecD
MTFRTLVVYALIAVFLAGVFLQAQGTIEIRAASSTAVAGWQRATVANGESLWISPSVSLRAADIARSEVQTLPDGRTNVNVVLTDDGAKKMDVLSRAQANQRIALMLDGKVVWAPVVRDPIGQQALVSGLPAAEAQRLQLALQKK